MTLRLPHPLIMLVAGVAIAAGLTWVLPAGDYARREDPATHRSVVVAGTYHTVPRSPVGPFAAVVALPRGFVEGADVIAVVLFVGGAWVVIDRLGILGRLIASLVAVFRRRGLLAIPVVALFFGVMGALENMQEEIIPLIPVLLLLGAGIGIDAVAVVGMSVGAAMIGSAFGPTNPFQAGIALKLAQLPPTSFGLLRLAMLVIGLALWVAWTVRHAIKHRTEVPPPMAVGDASPAATMSRKDLLLFLIAIAPMGFYVYGSIAFGWGFNELSAGFFAGAFVAGLWGGLGLEGTTIAYLEGMQGLLPAAMLIGVARSISLVLADGHVIDTILQGLTSPLAHAAPATTAYLMIPAQGLIHVIVPSASGQAVLTMPVFVPLSDLLGISRQVTVLAYQTGCGLCEMLTPTNGALMAVLLAARVPFGRWMRFAVPGAAIALVVGIVGMGAAMVMS
ncbi:MAG TPA: hypothetical protein VN600_01710 [Gemmatimonadaceae bacterium]|nr:hypothetical protein [Gemmatimonadaceae bacterium]